MQAIRKKCVAISKLDGVEFKIMKITRDKEGYLIIIKEFIHQEDVTTLSAYASNSKLSKVYMKPRLKELKNSEIILEISALSAVDRTHNKNSVVI